MYFKRINSIMNKLNDFELESVVGGSVLANNNSYFNEHKGGIVDACDVEDSTQTFTELYGNSCANVQIDKTFDAYIYQ